MCPRVPALGTLVRTRDSGVALVILLPPFQNDFSAHGHICLSQPWSVFPSPSQEKGPGTFPLGTKLKSPDDSRGGVWCVQSPHAEVTRGLGVCIWGPHVNMVFLGGIGICSSDQNLQEAPAETAALALVEAPALTPGEASAPSPAKTPAPVEASVPALVPVEVPAEAEASAEIPVEALAQAEAPAQYPSEPLIRSMSEDNQIPSHLPACPSLRHIASLRGRAVVEFFHSSIAEVGLAPVEEGGSVVPELQQACLGLSFRFPAFSVLDFPPASALHGFEDLSREDLASCPLHHCLPLWPFLASVPG